MGQELMFIFSSTFFTSRWMSTNTDQASLIVGIVFGSLLLSRSICSPFSPILTTLPRKLHRANIDTNIIHRQ